MAHTFPPFFAGPPSDGKKDITEHVAKNHHYIPLNVRELLKAEMDSGSEDGKKIRQCQENHETIPPEIIIKLLDRAMKGGKKFIVEEWPWTYDDCSKWDQLVSIFFLFHLLFSFSFPFLTDACMRADGKPSETHGLHLLGCSFQNSCFERVES
jgi:hypothetical protein